MMHLLTLPILNTHWNLCVIVILDADNESLSVVPACDRVAAFYLCHLLVSVKIWASHSQNSAQIEIGFNFLFVQK